MPATASITTNEKRGRAAQTADPMGHQPVGAGMTTTDSTRTDGSPATITMRGACQHCGATTGTITHRNGQNVVHCRDCHRYQYCAPKHETGERPLTLQNRIGTKPSVRARILREWDHRCGYCGTEAIDTNGGLHLAHIVDRKDAAQYGLLDELIDDPANLIPACAACNLGENHLDPKRIKLIVRFMLIAHRREQANR